MDLNIVYIFLSKNSQCCSVNPESQLDFLRIKIPLVLFYAVLLVGLLDREVSSQIFVKQINMLKTIPNQ